MFFPNAHMAPMPQFSPMAMHHAAPFAQGMTQAYTGSMGAAGAITKPAGGLLGKLMGGLGGGGRQSLNLMSIIQNTQRVVGMVQTVTPMVQQYGPIIRNLPALYKIMKSTPSSNSDSNIEDSNAAVVDTDNSISNEVSNTEVTPHVPIELSTDKVTNPVQQTKQKITPIAQKKFIPKPIKGIPGPKMYI